MLSRYARFAQVLEILLYAVAVAWLHQGHGWSFPAALTAAVAVALLARLAIVATSTMLGHLNRSPRPAERQLDGRGTLRYFLAEYRAFCTFNFLALPWDRWWLGPEPAAAKSDVMPVLLVHGYFSNRGYFRHLARRIAAFSGATIYAPNFRTWFASIESFEDEIHAAIERMCAETGQPKVFVVAHSMGGLGMRAYLVRRGVRRVAGLVTLATPHCGTVLARLGAGENARQMRQGSVFLSELERMEEIAAHPPTVSIYSAHDNLVAPQDCSKLEWANRNVALAGYGHLTILCAPEAWPPIEAAMRSAGAVARA
jgi:predicted alpha/beta hydrolase family esterase